MRPIAAASLIVAAAGGGSAAPEPPKPAKLFASVPVPRAKPPAAADAIPAHTGSVAPYRWGQTVVSIGETPITGDAGRGRTRGAAPSPAPAAASPPVTVTSRGVVVAAVPPQTRAEAERSRSLSPSVGSKWHSADLAFARDHCMFVLAATNIGADRLPAVGGPDGCGIPAPLKVAAFGAVDVKPEATLNCRMAAVVYKWVTEVVQPAAREAFGEAVTGIRNASAYSCRRMNNARSGQISEHSFGNALDISAFVLASGKEITVAGDWSTILAFLGTNGRAGFLKKIHAGACQHFATVLGPRYDSLHGNHFHVDIGRGGEYKICK